MKVSARNLLADWWNIATGRGRLVPALAVSIVALLLLFGYKLNPLRAAEDLNIGVLNYYLLMSVAGLVSWPLLVRAPSPFASKRASLLPLSSAQRLVLRLMFGNIGGTLGCAVAFLTFSTVLATVVPARADVTVLQVLRLVVIFGSALVFLDVLGTYVAYKAPNLLFWSTLLLALFSMQELVRVNPWGGMSQGVFGAAEPLASWFSFRPDATFASEAVLVMLSLVMAGTILALNMALTRQVQRPRVAARQWFRRRSTLLARYPLVAKELWYCVRPIVARNALIVALLITGLAFAAGTPFLLLFNFMFWTLLSQNTYGFDLPLDGLTRYQLIPIPRTRILHTRELVVGGVAAIVFLPLWFVSAVFHPIGLWLSFLAWFLLGYAAYLMVALVGRWTSSARPISISRSTVMLRGGVVSMRGYLAASLATTAVFALVLAIYRVLRSADWIGSTLAVFSSAALIAGLYATLAMIERRSGKTLDQALATAEGD